GVDADRGGRRMRGAPRELPPVPGMGWVRREPVDGAVLRGAVPAVASHVAVRDRAPAPGYRRGGRLVAVPPAPAPRLTGAYCRSRAIVRSQRRRCRSAPSSCVTRSIATRYASRSESTRTRVNARTVASG